MINIRFHFLGRDSENYCAKQVPQAGEVVQFTDPVPHRGSWIVQSVTWVFDERGLKVALVSMIEA